MSSAMISGLFRSSNCSSFAKERISCVWRSGISPAASRVTLRDVERPQLLASRTLRHICSQVGVHCTSSLGGWMTRRSVLRRSAALILAFAAAHSIAGAALAECPFIPPFPKAEPAIRSADEVIVGELIQSSSADLDLGPNQVRRMALRVTEVLRGPKAVGDLVDVEYL